MGDHTATLAGEGAGAGAEIIEYSPSVDAAAAARVAEAMTPQLELLGFAATPRYTELLRTRGPGRPAGARNKREEQVAREVIARFGDPLLHQAAIATMPVAELAALMGGGVAEALAEKRLAAVAVLPYLHQRQPQAVDLHDHRSVSLTINMGSEGNQEVVDVVLVDVGQPEVGQHG